MRNRRKLVLAVEEELGTRPWEDVPTSKVINRLRKKKATKSQLATAPESEVDEDDLNDREDMDDDDVKSTDQVTEAKPAPREVAQVSKKKTSNFKRRPKDD